MADNHISIENHTPEPEVKSQGEENITDPKVLHDPVFKSEGIARYYAGEAKTNMENGEVSDYNFYDTLKSDGVQYPLLTINDKNIEDKFIIDYTLYYNEFLPTISVLIEDPHQQEQKINSTQLSGTIRTCITSSVDKVYRKIILQFRIDDVYIDHNNPIYVRYNGTLDIPGFRQTNLGHIWMADECTGPFCQHQGKINANTWEMLHELAIISGLGFAATKETKEIEDRALRIISSKRIDSYIESQIRGAGFDEDSILDAWVDLYGYIVLVNVSYIFNTELQADDLKIVANYGFNTMTKKLPDQKPQKVSRTLTNWTLLSTISNMQINKYSMEIDNDIISWGTLERSYNIKFERRSNCGSLNTILNLTDIQAKQDSIDGEFLEDYNTGAPLRIPRFNFNCHDYVSDPNDESDDNEYDFNLQSKIRNKWFENKRQSILKVQLSQINLGLQRGTLVNVAIFENDIVNKGIIINQPSNLLGPNDDKKDAIYQDDTSISNEYSKGTTLVDDGVWAPNLKLSGMYYIDSMEFKFNQTEYNEIVQILYLIKKGSTSGYNNRHTTPRVKEVEKRETLEEIPFEAEDANLSSQMPSNGEA